MQGLLCLSFRRRPHSSCSAAPMQARDLTVRWAAAQDVFHRMAGPHACQGLLRLRASPGLCVSRPLGPLLPDARLPDVARLPSFHAATCLAFELEHAPSTPVRSPAVLQMALQYTCLAAAAPAAGGSPDGRWAPGVHA